MAAEDQSEMEIGRFMRDARVARGLTLADTAERSGLSTTHLSRMERSHRQPSLSVLRQLAAIYQVSMAELLGEDTAPRRKLVQKATRPPLDETADGRYIALTGLAGHRGLGVVELELSHDISRHQFRNHEDEELIYVQRGSVELVLDSEPIALEAGDSVHFDARTPHLLRPLTPEPAIVLVVCAPLRTQQANGHV